MKCPHCNKDIPTRDVMEEAARIKARSARKRPPCEHCGHSTVKMVMFGGDVWACPNPECPGNRRDPGK